MSEKKKYKGKDKTQKKHIFRRLWEGWKKIARIIGDFNARVILTIFYFVLLFPFAMLMKIFTDPLEIKKKAHTGWHDKEEDNELTAFERAARQS